MSFDIVALGEALIDMVWEKGTGSGVTLRGNPGGAPANVMTAGAKLGRKTAVISKVGSDGFGELIKSSLRESGVNTDYIISTSEFPTTLAMVSLDASGNRSFSFYRTGTADVMLSWDEVDEDVISNTRIFHFGSVTMTAEPVRSATFRSAEKAREAGAVISFDPNLREPLWDSMESARENILRGLSVSHIVKLSFEELEFLTDRGEAEERARKLYEQYGLKLLVVTLGADGAFGICPDGIVYSRAYDTPCVDTTGAGDSFWGAFLTGFLELEKSPAQVTKADFEKLLPFSNAAGSVTTTKYGAIPALPTREEILHCMDFVPLL